MSSTTGAWARLERPVVGITRTMIALVNMLDATRRPFHPLLGAAARRQLDDIVGDCLDGHFLARPTNQRQYGRRLSCPATVAMIIGGRQKLDAVNVAIAAVANLMLNLMLIPFLGLAGAAFATATSLIGLAMVRCLEVRRVFGLRTLDFTPLRAMLVTVPLTLAIWAVSRPPERLRPIIRGHCDADLRAA